ncbi:putative RNA-directed DNA polymerase [Tanacetum coccineum]
MGLDDVFNVVRSSILIIEPLPDVKSSYATLSRDESHRVNNVHYVVNKTSSSSTFMSRSSNDWSTNISNQGNQNNQNKRFNRGPNPNLVYKHCNMIGHTVDRCFELVGYPAGFKKNFKCYNPKATINNVSTCSVGNTHMLTSDEYQKLMGLLRSSRSCTTCDIGNVTGIPIGSNLVLYFASCRLFNLNTNTSTYSTYIGWIIDSWASQHMTYSTIFLFNVIDVSHINIIVAHPNRTIEKVNQVRSFKVTETLIIHDVLVVPGTQLKSPWLPSVVLSGKSPYELVYNTEPDFSHIKSFGCLCFAKVLNNFDKFAERSKKYVFIGYYLDSKGYKLYSLDSKQVLYSRDCKFYEIVYPFKNQSLTKDFIMKLDDINSLNFFDNQTPNDPYDDVRESVSKDVGTMSASKDNAYSNKLASAKGFVDLNAEPESDPAVTDDSANHPASTRDKTVHDTNVLKNSDPTGSIIADGASSHIDATSDDENYESEGEEFGNFGLLFSSDDGDPKSIVDGTVRRSDRNASLPSRLKDYELQGKVKYGLNIYVNYTNLSSKNYAFITNLNKVVEPMSYREASTDSFSQKEGIDYEDTFSPVVKMVTVRCVLSLVVKNKWYIFQLDVNNAFLYGDLDEYIYMSLPDGFFVLGNQRVFKLKRSLYGLKQAPRKCNENLSSVLSELGFNQIKNDHSLFVKSNDNVIVVILVYVDDIIITGNSNVEIETFINMFSEKFLIKDLGELKYLLGIKVIKCDNGIYLTQRKYCIELLDEFGMLGCKPASTPIEVNLNKQSKKIIEKNDYPLICIGNFQKLIGKLIYLTITRRDIAYVVHKLSQAMHGPLKSNLKLAFRVPRYLKGALGKGVLYSPSNLFELTAYVDSDWPSALLPGDL